MTRAPIASTLQLPEWTRHSDQTVEAVLVGCWLHCEFGLSPLGYVAEHAPEILTLGDDTTARGLNSIAEELALAAKVAQCTLRSEFADLTHLHSWGPVGEDAVWHAGIVRDDARVQAEMLTERARRCTT